MLARHGPSFVTVLGFVTVLVCGTIMDGPAVLSAQEADLGARETEVAQAVRDLITTEALERHAAAIVEHVRPSGSPGENAAIDYIVATLTEAGVPVQVHTFEAYASDPVSARVEVPGTDFAPDAITMSFSGVADGVEARLVDVGSLRDLPGLEIGTGENLILEGEGLGGDLYERFAEVRGAVVLVEGQPRNIPTMVLQRLGAVAAIFMNPEERLNKLIVTSTWGMPSLRNFQRLPSLPTAEIRKGAGETLRAMLREGEVRVRVSTEVRTGWKPLRIVVATIEPGEASGPGLAGDEALSGASLSGEALGGGSLAGEAPFVLFGGHIDGWHHGGTDEGASNAAMLEAAIAFHQKRDRISRGLVVAWWPGHSNARYGGSTWFMDHYYEDMRTRGMAYVNIDGVGQIDAKRFSASVSEGMGRLARRVVAAEQSGALRTSRPGRNSDQAFNGSGVPLFQLGHSRLAEDGGYWWWHTPDDTFDKIDFDILQTDIGLYVDALTAMLTRSVYPVDLVAQAEALGEAIAMREEASAGRLDLAAARLAQERLLDRVAAIAAMLDDVSPGRALDLALMRIHRPVHRVLYVPGSDHHPDPGIYGRPLPGLEPARILASADPSSDRYRFAEASLLRERNRLVEAIVEATREADRLEELLRVTP